MKEGVEGYPGVAWQKTALKPPDILKVPLESITDHSMTLEWSEVDGAEYYYVDVSPSGGVQGSDGPIPGTQVDLRGLTPNTIYTLSAVAPSPKNLWECTLKIF